MIEIQTRSDLHILLDAFSLPRVVAEIGVAEGRFSEEILLNWRVDKLILVDIFETVPFIDGCASYDQSWHNLNYAAAMKLANVSKKVRVIKNFSHKAAAEIEDESLGLVYLDADHSYKGALSDLEAWFPKVVKGGIISCHDYKNEAYGVGRAVDNFTVHKNKVYTIPEGGNDTASCWFQKL